jgi:hypothetical protein
MALSDQILNRRDHGLSNYKDTKSQISSFLVLIEFNDWRYRTVSHVGICDRFCELLPLYPYLWLALRKGTDPSFLSYAIICFPP